MNARASLVIDKLIINTNFFLFCSGFWWSCGVNGYWFRFCHWQKLFEWDILVIGFASGFDNKPRWEGELSWLHWIAYNLSKSRRLYFMLFPCIWKVGHRKLCSLLKNNIRQLKGLMRCIQIECERWIIIAQKCVLWKSDCSIQNFNEWNTEQKRTSVIPNSLCSYNIFTAHNA